MVDVQLAVDMMAFAHQGVFTKASLVTGDLDFKPLVDALVGMTVDTARLFVDKFADDLGNRTATDEETQQLRQLIAEPLRMAHNLLMNVPMQRPEWPSATPAANEAS
jgi:uncharacterized LabA/DUF88 family protein